MNNRILATKVMTAYQGRKGDAAMKAERCCALIGTIMLAIFSLPTDTSAVETLSKEAKIARAMEAAPVFITKDATFIDSDGTVLKQGTNGWTCIPASARNNFV